MKNTKFKRTFDNNWFIFKFAIKTSPSYVIMNIMFCICQATMMFLEHILLITYVLDCILDEKPFRYAVYYIGAVFVLSILWICIHKSYNALYGRKAQEKLFREANYIVYKKVMEMDISCYDNPEYYNDFVWAMSEASNRINAVVRTVSGLAWDLTNIIASGLFVVTTDLTGLIFVAVTFVTSYFCNKKINQLAYERDIELRPKQRRRDYINRVFYLSDYAKEIRLSDIKNKLYDDYGESNESIKETIKASSKKLTLYSFLNDFVFNTLVINGIYIVYIAYKVSIGALSGGDMVGLFLSSRKLNSGLSGLTYVFPRFQQNSMYIDKLRNFLSYENTIKSKAEALPVPKEICALKLNNVSFSYDENQPPVLKGINMAVKPCEKIAIVGQNGAGKTTLINLILRLYDACGGSIEYNGVDIKEYDLKCYRDVFATAFQDYQLFAATVGQNIIMDNTEPNEKKLEGAVQKGDFFERLKSLKNGFNTVLTKEFDYEGTDLSGGEAQKIAISRVFYKDSGIVILDEPSAALDPISEAHLNQAIIEALKDKTVIFISHRLSTTRMADRIYFIDNGVIAEEGSHDELMKLGGKYAYMFNLQAEKYKDGCNETLAI
jgi:ATP-binding cassette subfamily B protein